MSNAIEVTALHLRYRVAEQPARSVKELAVRAARRDLRRTDVTALDGVELIVPVGELVGLIGANGAGKSTLLRCLGGVLPPTTGRVVVRGRITPVLDLVSGFHPELTGTENVELLGALLGRDYRAMRRRAPVIAAWAGVEHAMGRPLRTFSTGMVARLAFAVVTDDTPDVLLLDEVLAVGDEDFQRRCIARLNDMVAAGATVVLVTHDLRTIETLMSRVVWLDAGRVRADGQPGVVINAYREAVGGPAA